MITTVVEVALFLGGSVLAALGGMLLVRRTVPQAALERHKESAGFVYATLGVAYAVLLTFVVIAVWEQFRDAEQLTEQEATAVATLFHLADGFGADARRDVQETIVAYTRAVVDEEWTLLAAGQVSARAGSLVDHLWQHYTAMLAPERGQAEYTESLEQMGTFSALRSQRLLHSRAMLPTVIWSVLLVGGIITVAYTYLFGVSSAAAQLVMTTALTVVLASGLFLIYALDNPYRGASGVSPEAFRTALAFFTRHLGE
jgi:hypothetical protein